MAEVEYTVDRVDGVWTVGLGEKRFGPYSSLETATAAAMSAASKAEGLGHVARVVINGSEDEAQPGAAA